MTYGDLLGLLFVCAFVAGGVLNLIDRRRAK